MAFRYKQVAARRTAAAAPPARALASALAPTSRPPLRSWACAAWT